MPMPKKANGGNLKVSDGKLTVRFDTDGPRLEEMPYYGDGDVEEAE